MKRDVKEVVVEAVLKEYALSFDELTSRSWKQHLADARHVVSGVLQEYGVHPATIGELLHRNRTTIITSRQRYADYYATDPAFRRKADAVKTKVEKAMKKRKR